MPNELVFPKISRFDRVQEPCSIAMPFARGALADAGAFAITDGPNVLPTQAVATAAWPDGSVKWLHADVLVDLPGNASKTLGWSVDASARAAVSPAARAECSGGRNVIESGVVAVHLGRPGAAPIERIETDGFALSSGALRGPVFTDEAGVEWTAVLGDAGWRVLRPGPVHAIVEGTGKHVNSEGRSQLDFQLRIHVFAGKPWVQIDYRFINREDVDHLTMASLAVSVHPGRPGTDIHTAVATSNYRTRIRRGEKGQRVSHHIDADQSIYEGNEQVPEVHYGTFWADWTDPERGGLCVTVHQAQQNYPKALTADRDGITVALYPDASPSLRLPRGVARTQRLLLHPHGADVDAALTEVGIRSLQFQMPDRPIVPTEVYQAAGVFEPVWIAKSLPQIESFLIDSADRRARGYGLLNWGDGPDASYTNQGRGRGKPVWTNNEYDLPHAAMLMFARTGERRMLDYLLVTAEHQMDVDICHFSADPMRHGGQIVHSAGHVSGGVTPSHEWVEGLLDLYHATADMNALDAAIGVGENLLRQLERPAFRQAAGSSARETGWALRALTALYCESHDRKWLEPAEFIVSQFREWQRDYGAWLAPYTDHTLARVPFMISVAASSLMRYYWVTGDSGVGEMIVSAMRDLIENALRPDGRFYYKELPSLEHRGAGFYVLEALAYAYDISGDATFIRAGMITFEEALRQRPAKTGSKYCVDDAVVWDSGPSPKAFASTFHPIAMFARAAVDCGLIAPPDRRVPPICTTGKRI